MRNMILILALSMMCTSAWGAYQLRINGTPVADYGVPGTLDYTATVGQVVHLEVWSDSKDPVHVDPDTVQYPSKYEAFQLSTTVLPTYTLPPDKLSNVTVNYALAGPYAVAPYGNQSTLLWIGWTQTPTQTVGPGLWFSADWTPVAEGDRMLSIFCYLPGYGKNPLIPQQNVRLHQIPEPAPQDFDLEGFVSTWLCGTGDPLFDPQFDLVEDGFINLLDFNVFAKMQGDVIYVSAVDGNDNNPGTLDSPFATIEKAHSVVLTKIAGGMDSDVVVYIRGGTYLLSNALTFDSYNDSGKNGYRVIYKGYQNEMPLISATQAITGWQLDSGNIYKVNIGTTWKPQALFENGQWARKARTPNTGYFSADTGSTGKRTLVYRPGDVAAFGITDATVQVWSGSFLGGAGVWNYDWMANTALIAAANWDTRTLTLSQDAWFDLAVYNRYYLQGAREFLDAPGEWYHDTTTGWLYYYPYATPISSQQILGGKSKNLFRIQGVPTKKAGYITFESLHFSMSDSLLQYRQYTDDWDGMLRLENAEYVRFNKCHFSNPGTCALSFNGHVQNCEVTNSLIENCGIHGIAAKGFGAGYGGFTSPEEEYVNKFNTIHNNHIRNTGKIVAHGWGINLYHSGDNTITHNKFENLPRHGVLWGSDSWEGLQGRTIYGIPVTWENRLRFCYARNNLIAYNELVNCMNDSSDGGPINSGSTGANNRIENNFVRDSTGLPASAGMGSMLMGIYLDDGSNFTTVRKNIVTRLNGAATVLPYVCKGEGNVFENNIDVNNPTAQKHITVQQLSTGLTLNSEFARNIFHQIGGNYIFEVYRSPWDNAYINQMIASSDYNVIYHTSGTYRVHRPAAPSYQQNMSWTTWKSYGYEANSITGQDPLFTNIAADDYTLLPGSPALSRGFEQIDLSTVGLTEEYPF